MTERSREHYETTDRFAIRVQGYLDCRWAEWFEGLEMRQAGDGTSVLSGALDQAALHGVLRRIRDLGLPLVSIQTIDGREQGESS